MKKFKLLAAAAALSVSGAASALPLITDWAFINEAGFLNAQPNSAITSSGDSADGGTSIFQSGSSLPDNICWGNPVGANQSCLSIYSQVTDQTTQIWDANGNLVDINGGAAQGDASTLAIGTADYWNYFSQGTSLKHDNFAITGTFLDTVTIVDALRLMPTNPAIQFDAPELQFFIDFTETPNRTAGASCPFGVGTVGTAGSVNVNGCADSFAIGNAAGASIIAQSTSFIDFAVQFELNTGGQFHEDYEIITRLSGLEVFDNGTKIGFLTPEAGISVLNAQFVIRAIDAPEPSTLAVFGLGLLGLAGLSRRKFKK